MTTDGNVSVTFIDAETNESIGEAVLAAAELPETFDQLETKLHLGGADWVVVRAEPLSRAEFAIIGELKLHLRRVVLVDTSKILYSLPSLCDVLPPVDANPRTGNELVMHEDDFRQFELVLVAHAERCDKEIAAIRRIHEEEFADPGWRKIHAREYPDPPMDRRFSIEEVKRRFGLSGAIAGVTFERYVGVLRDAWSFTAADGQQFYGLAPGGLVSVFAVVQEEVPNVPISSIEILKALASDFELELVNWNRCARADAADSLFGRLMVENAGHVFEAQ